MSRLIGNDKVPPEAQSSLRIIKAVRQGIQLRAPTWWPALTSLTDDEMVNVRRQVRDFYVWQAALPRYSADGRRFA